MSRLWTCSICLPSPVGTGIPRICPFQILLTFRQGKKKRLRSAMRHRLRSKTQADLQQFRESKLGKHTHIMFQPRSRRPARQLLREASQTGYQRWPNPLTSGRGGIGWHGRGHYTSTTQAPPSLGKWSPSVWEAIFSSAQVQVDSADRSSQTRS